MLKHGRVISPALDPLSRRLLALAGLLSLLLIAVVVNYLSHEGGAVLNPVAQAAERTAAMPGARLKMEVTYTVEGSTRKIVGSGVGAVNTRTDREWAVLHVPRPTGGSVTARAVADDRVLYLKSAELAAKLPAGKQWFGIEPFLGHSTESFESGVGAGRTMRALEAFDGEVEEVDHQLVRGRQTTHYKATLDMSRIAQGLQEDGDAKLAELYERLAAAAPAPVPVEVWVDEAGRVRLLRMVQQLPDKNGGPALTMDMRTEYLAFGAQPKIKLPLKRSVFDFTPALRAEFGMLDGNHLGTFEPPARAKPLSVMTFRRRARGICRAILPAARRVLGDGKPLIARLRAFGRSELEAGAGKPALAALGRWAEERVVPLARREESELARLAPPRAYAGRYQRYLDLNVLQLEEILGEGRAWRMGASIHHPETHKAEARQRKHARHHLAAALGIPICEKSASPPEAQTESA
jgi:hypothetical protein